MLSQKIEFRKKETYNDWFRLVLFEKCHTCNLKDFSEDYEWIYLVNEVNENTF